ncbi:putative hydroxymethylpyrimidine transport system ATP-binding protein [Erwinia persicina]|uniref:ABC transporter ATP-binding protein n=1 Tax=Erwinia persicina TaxID=55211 RepID=UPI00209E41FD|nr:ABC transporter ATP-binding protein [Erwinia persicina]MCP1436867.1 putative hydroxymethylpyrimidine transport system ATP-binding protein [Erwinia persicina]
MTPGIEVKAVSLHFSDRTLFKQLSFTLAGGRFTSLLGPSGVGKSSLLKIIAGLLAPSTGSVLGSDGLPVAGRIAWMGQRDLLYPWLSAIDNVALGARLRGEKADRQWAEHLLERVGLAGNAGALPTTLSGGMRQRVALARTLYERRPIVLMDEPFSALDAITRAQIQALAAELLADCTVLLITHDPVEACRLSHRLLILSAAGLSELPELAGQPPRAPDDPNLLRSQAQLMRQLTEDMA